MDTGKDGQGEEEETVHRPQQGVMGRQRSRHVVWWLTYLTHPRGEDHLVANPRHPAENRLSLPEGPGGGGLETGTAEAEVEEGGGTQGDESAAPPSPVRLDQGQECHEATESGTKN